MPNKTKKPVSQKTYLKDNNKCPFCRSENIIGHSIELDSNSVWQEISCNDCDKTWKDVYKLVGYEE